MGPELIKHLSFKLLPLESERKEKELLSFSIGIIISAIGGMFSSLHAMPDEISPTKRGLKHFFFFHSGSRMLILQGRGRQAVVR